MKAVQHIEIDPAKCGGKPCIAGTRIRVWDVTSLEFLYQVLLRHQVSSAVLLE